MRVEVTWDDIKNGTRSDPEYCAVARAIERATGQRASVPGVWLRVFDGEGRSRSVPAPLGVRLFVCLFDMAPHVWPLVRPFAFELETS